MDDGFGIVCGVLVLVLIFNLGILVPILRRRGKIFENPFKEFRPPWEVEKKAVEELRKSLQDLDHISDKEKHTPDGQ